VLVLGWASGHLPSSGIPDADGQTGGLLRADAAVARCGLLRLAAREAGAVLPLTQGGDSVREAALVVLLAPFGAPGHLVLAAGWYGKAW